MRIQWTEDNDFGGLDGDWRQIPTWAIEQHSSITALVVMNGFTKFDEPVFIHPLTAHQLAGKGVLERFAIENLTSEQLVFDYDGKELLLQLYVGPF